MTRNRIVGTTLGVVGASAIIIKSILTNTAYNVTRVIDGDTFETREKQIVRINGIDAPESGLCGGVLSRQTLSNLIEGKKVYLKVVYFDSYHRQVSNVYLPNGSNVAYIMAGSGQAIVFQKGISDPSLLEVGKLAREAKKGLHGLPCTQENNIKNPSCVIKGNINDSQKTKYYHYPGCSTYKNAIVQLYQGDEWFCTEQSAIRAGYVKSASCPK